MGAVSVEVPDSLARKGEGIDSAAVYLEGHDMSVLIDQGPFAGPHVAGADLPDYDETEIQIAGLPATRVFYRRPDSGYTLAAHIPRLNRLTVAIKAKDSVPREVAEGIIQSIQTVE